MVDISWDVYMVVDLKVHVEIVHYTGRQGSNMRARDSFFPELAKVMFWSTDLAWFSEIFSHETPAKDNRGVRERFAKVLCLFAKSGSSQIKEFRSTAIYLIIWWRFETNPLTTGGHHLVHFLFSGDESMPAPAKRHVTDPTGSMTITSVHLQRNFCDAFWIILMQILRASDTSLVFLRVTNFPYVEAEIDWGWRSWWLHQRGWALGENHRTKWRNGIFQGIFQLTMFDDRRANGNMEQAAKRRSAAWDMDLQFLRSQTTMSPC